MKRDLLARTGLTSSRVAIQSRDQKARKSAGKYFLDMSDNGNTFRPFKPKGGFKRDRREGQLPARKQQGTGKHIDLKALRNNGDPVKTEKSKRP